MTTQNKRSLLFFSILFITTANISYSYSLAATTVTSENNKTIYEVLVQHGLPEGLLPKRIENYTLSEDGKFEVFLEQACTTKFEDVLCYNETFSGQLKFAQILNLTGVSAKDLFLWFPVRNIRVDIPSSGIIYFDIGVAFKQFPLADFERSQDCLALSRPPTNTPNVLAKRFEGAIRHRFGQGGNAREVM